MSTRAYVVRPIVGICHMQLCVAADASDEEILAEANRMNPSGTRLGWASVVHSGDGAPVTCEQTPGRLHVLVEC